VELLVLIVMLAVVGAVAVLRGTDSRDGNDWVVHRRP
jgi:hypothetical protein